jgi:hypothetical protein
MGILRVSPQCTRYLVPYKKRAGRASTDRTERFPQETLNSRFRDSVVLKNEEKMMKNRQKDLRREKSERNGDRRDGRTSTWHLSYVSARQVRDAVGARQWGKLKLELQRGAPAKLCVGGMGHIGQIGLMAEGRRTGFQTRRVSKCYAANAPGRRPALHQRFAIYLPILIKS